VTERVLITGGAGVIGAHVADELFDRARVEQRAGATWARRDSRWLP